MPVSRGPQRRAVLTGAVALAGASLGGPQPLLAQGSDRVRRIGWLSGIPGVRPSLSGSLRDLGWVEGRNLAFEVRLTDGRRERAAWLANELVAAQVDLIIAVAPHAILGALQATRELPIVMAWWGGPDLVREGLIDSYARPGGNLTGVDMLLSLLDAKRLDLLRQAVPRATRIAVLIHDQHLFEPQLPPVREAARQLGLVLEVFNTHNGRSSYSDVLAAVTRSQCQALLVMSSPMFAREGKLIVEAAARALVPAIYPEVRHAHEGGLLAYSTTPLELDRQVARQVDRILRGAQPGTVPVEQPSRYELAVNQATARSLGLVVPRALLLQASQVIE